MKLASVRLFSSGINGSSRRRVKRVHRSAMYRNPPFNRPPGRQVCFGIHSCKRAQTVRVYGGVPEVDLSEDAPMGMTGEPYGDGQIHAERVVHALSSKSALNLTIVRPTVIYGPGDDKFLPKVIENLKSGQARINGPSAEAPAAHAVALGVAGSMELVAAVTKRPPRLTRHAVRVVGKQHRYRTERAQSVGFRPACRCSKASPSTWGSLGEGPRGPLRPAEWKLSPSVGTDATDWA